MEDAYVTVGDCKNFCFGCILKKISIFLSICPKEGEKIQREPRNEDEMVSENEDECILNGIFIRVSL